MAQTPEDRLKTYMLQRQKAFSISKQGLFTHKKSKIAAIIIVLLFISIIVLAIIYAWTTQFLPNGKNTPHGHMTSHGSADDDFIIMVQTMDSQGAGVVDVKYQLKNSQNETIEEGIVSEIYGLDPGFPEYHLAFIDRDLDSKISASDLFYLRSKENGGFAEEGMTLEFIHTYYQELMMKQTLSRERTLNDTYPTAMWNVTELDNSTVSMNVNQSASDHAQVLVLQTVQFHISFNIIGNDSRKLLLSVNDSMGNKSHQIISTEPGTPVEFMWEEVLRYNFSGNASRVQEYICSIEVQDRDTFEVLMKAETTIFVTMRGITLHSFSPVPFFITLSLASVFLTAIARKTKRTNN